MKKEVSLQKGSSPEEIKLYFSKVLTMAKQDNPFPVDFDDVWPLVYGRRDNSFSALRCNYILDVDYILLFTDNQNDMLFAENGQKNPTKVGGLDNQQDTPTKTASPAPLHRSQPIETYRPRVNDSSEPDPAGISNEANWEEDPDGTVEIEQPTDSTLLSTDMNLNGRRFKCYLSLSCMEFFIARKIRPVFEVYRQVFHRTFVPLVPDTPAPSAARVIVLHRHSRVEDIAEYLAARKQDAREGDRFPIPVDDVYALAYSAKRRVIDRLTSTYRSKRVFEEGVDYEIRNMRGVNRTSGRPIGKYYMNFKTFFKVIAFGFTNTEEAYLQVFSDADLQGGQPLATSALLPSSTPLQPLLSSRQQGSTDIRCQLAEVLLGLNRMRMQTRDTDELNEIMTAMDAMSRYEIMLNT